MIITHVNCKEQLPQKLWDQFMAMSGREMGRAIIFQNQILRWANSDEY